MKCSMNMDKLPTVISCCFCCFLRAGTVMIAVVSFMVGLFFAPNVSQAKGAWDMSPVLGNYSSVTESTIQVILGVVSIVLCAISFLLLLGAICNLPILIEIYQWGVLVYSTTVSLLFLVLATFCFFVSPHSYLAGGLLCLFVRRRMCEIFPEVSKCCFVISLRIGMLIISILTIMTGVAGLCGIEKISDASYNKLKNVTDIRNPEQALSQISLIIPTGITVMSCIFMFTGLILLFATLTDAEGFVQIFVWVTFFTVIFGFFMVVATAFECVWKPKCILSGLDWLSGSALLILVVAYLFLWIYFIIVANSYIINVYS